jgi:hypothetical protein
LSRQAMWAHRLLYTTLNRPAMSVIGHFDRNSCF